MKRLTDEQVRQYLCYADPRSPNYKDWMDKQNGVAPPGCTCVNCIFHQHWMADTILAIRKVLGV